MDLTASLHISLKGEEEVTRRTYKLGIKKRSVLILLDKPRTVEYLATKSVIPKDEFIEEIHSLIREGFVALAGESGAFEAVKPVATNSEAATRGGTVAGGSLDLDDGIILSEARFLLIDFCVDSFGTKSQGFVDEVRACKSANDLRGCLVKILAATETNCRQQLPVLFNLVTEINETA